MAFSYHRQSRQTRNNSVPDKCTLSKSSFFCRFFFCGFCVIFSIYIFLIFNSTVLKHKGPGCSYLSAGSTQLTLIQKKALHSNTPIPPTHTHTNIHTHIHTKCIQEWQQWHNTPHWKAQPVSRTVAEL